jgi:hypothetical protein
MAKLTAAQRLYRELYRVNSDVRWIAGVLMDCSKPTTRLQGLKRLLEAGHDVRPWQFKMPYEALCVDGRCIRAEILATKAQNLDAFAYVS